MNYQIRAHLSKYLPNEMIEEIDKPIREYNDLQKHKRTFLPIIQRLMLRLTILTQFYPYQPAQFLITSAHPALENKIAEGLAIATILDKRRRNTLVDKLVTYFNHRTGNYLTI